MRKHVLFSVLKAYLLVGFLTGCGLTDKPDVQSLFGYSMGTSYHIKVVSSVAEAQRLQLGIEGILSDVNARMSTYLPNSDLSKFKDASENSKVGVDGLTARVVDRSLEIAALTEGYFDPTIAPLVELWGFGPSAMVNEKPSTEDISRLHQMVGYQQVTVDLEGSSLLKMAPRELDLSAIAKGYAVDLVAQYLDSKGISSYLVEIGGEMRGLGQKPNGEAWRIAIETPEAGQRSVYEIISLENVAIATSGDYRNYFESDGVRYSHTINPKTGYPVTHDLASASVVMANCMDADAFATAFMAMGTEKALKLANQQGIAAYLIYRSSEGFKSVASKEFLTMFQDELTLLKLEGEEI